MERPQRRLSAILAADVAGYSRLMGADESGTLARFNAIRAELLDPKIAQFEGRVVGSAGDSLLVEFASAVDAVQCAVEAQERLSAWNSDLPDDRRMAFRMGINLGDVIAQSDTIHGDGVNVASRLERLGESGTVVVSRSIHDQVKGKLPYSFTDLGEHTVKNITEPVRAFRVEPGDRPVVAPVVQAEDLPLPSKPSVAVLPFVNMSGDPEQEFFCDGITEDIITELSRNRGLFVIARNSSFVFKGPTADIGEVGRKLGVRYVLEGSVRKAGKRIRVTAQLVEAAAGNHVWAERYDRDLEDIFAVQDEITQRVVVALPARIEADRLRAARRKPTESMDAYDHVLHARQDYVLYTPEALARARRLLLRAIELDPDYAAAHASLSQVYWGEHWIGTSSDPEVWRERMFAHAETSLRLDDADARSHLQLGFVDLYRNRYQEARVEMEKALRLNPNEPEIPYCVAFHEMFEGRGEAAVDWVNRSMRMDPLGHYGYVLGMAHYVARDYDRAISALRTVRSGMITARAWLSACHARLDDPARARAFAREFDASMKASLEGAGCRVPKSWLAYFAERWPFRQEQDMNHLLDALRSAGLS
ncbi:MAG: adenylate/guanylate cyclase domain-containing protein [Alphaproteobacteria bacterium]